MSDLHITTPTLLKEGEHSALQIDGRHIMLCNVAGQHYAISNVCSHARVLLSEGKLGGYTITCPLHGGRFDVRTGRCLGGPAFQDIATFPVTVAGDNIIITTS